MLIQQFQLGELLGSGSYAQVYKARHLETNRICAIKILSSQPSQDVLDKIMKEMNIMIQCENQHIVRCFGSEINDYGICLFLEYCKGSVADLVKSSPHLRLSEYHIASILEPVLRGLDYLHANKKIHRDIKAANILVNQKGQVKLGDFGVSAQLIHTYADKDTIIGSPFWMSPQIISKTKYNYKTDIWSLGITAIELAERVPPYSHLHPVRAMFAIQNNPPKQLSNIEHWSPQFNSFVRKCLTVDASLRPTARQLLQHPFIVSKAKSADILLQLLATCSTYQSNSKSQKTSQKSQCSQIFQANQSGTMIEHSKVDDYVPFWEGQERDQNSDIYKTMVQKESEGQQQAPFMKFFKKPELTEQQKYKNARLQFQSLTNQMNAEINAIKQNYKLRMKRYQQVIKKYENSKVKQLESKERRLSLRKPALQKCFKTKKQPLQLHNNRIRTQMNQDKQTLPFDCVLKKQKNCDKRKNTEQQNEYYNMFMKNAKQRERQRQRQHKLNPKQVKQVKEWKDYKSRNELNQSNKTIEKIYSVIKSQNFNKTTKQLSFKR